MEDERFQQMEKRLNEQVEATQAMNETLNKFIAIMSNQEAAKSIVPLPQSPPLCRPHNPPELNQASPVTLMETECKGTLSSPPVSSTSHS
jgi:hypothetical protein